MDSYFILHFLFIFSLWIEIFMWVSCFFSKINDAILFALLFALLFGFDVSLALIACTAESHKCKYLAKEFIPIPFIIIFSIWGILDLNTDIIYIDDLCLQWYQFD